MNYMEYLDYKELLRETEDLLNRDDLSEDTNDEYLNRERQKLKWLCECSNGHHFDYRDRIKYPAEDKTHAPCQGMCPVCGSRQISMWSFMLYPRRFNYIGGLYG